MANNIENNQKDGFEKYLDVLKEKLSYVEDDSFSWSDVISVLIIELSNTDSINKANDASNATQIQLTSERDASAGQRKTEDFFPTLTLNTTFKGWRIGIPVRVNKKNVDAIGGTESGVCADWKFEQVQIRRRILNADSQGNGNPTLQICYGTDLMPLRRVLGVDDYLVFAKRKDSSTYEAFGVLKDVDLGKGKKMYVSAKAEKDSTNFGLSDITCNKTHTLTYDAGVQFEYVRNRIIFGAPGTGKSFNLNQDKDDILSNGGDYERVTFHPDYSYANFVGTYKPVMVSKHHEIALEQDKKEILAVLQDKTMSAQEKYDLLYDRFKDEGLTRLPILLGLYTDEVFKTKKQDGSNAVGDNSVERNHGKAIRPYVDLLSLSADDEEIAYQYVPGPFMRILAKALKSAMSDSPKPYLLLIEEINRANVAAVFGDVFQLLDRNGSGISEYEIATTNDMRSYLASELGVDEAFVETIRIPNNMFIWATMNSADQGVFPMDTAFKRRWDFTYLGIDDSEKDLIGKTVVLGTGNTKHKVEWNKLRKAINNFLAKEKINEDKQLGPYFIARNIVVPKEGTEIDNDRFIHTFKSKVIMYLFEDAAKQKRPKLFEGCFENSSRYSEICREFEKKGIGIFHHDIQLEAEPEDLTGTSLIGDE